METESRSEGWNVRAGNFEGPFGLLLGLIEKRKLHISDISLAQVTEDYLAHITNIGEKNPAEVSSFLLVASTLLLIKSKSLLPNLNLTNEEEGDIKNLEDRLRLYEIFTKLGLDIKKDFGKKMIFGAEEKKHTNIIFLPDERITRESMMAFARGAVGAMPKKVFLPQVEVRKVISIEEMISNLTERIQKSLTMSFKEFAGRGATREEKVVVIVGFLAMLELVKQGILNAIQENNYEDITIERQEAVLENNL
jgi:segregation and condensation protein A